MGITCPDFEHPRPKPWWYLVDLFMFWVPIVAVFANNTLVLGERL